MATATTTTPPFPFPGAPVGAARPKKTVVPDTRRRRTAYTRLRAVARTVQRQEVEYAPREERLALCLHGLGSPPPPLSRGGVAAPPGTTTGHFLFRRSSPSATGVGSCSRASASCDFGATTCTPRSARTALTAVAWPRRVPARSAWLVCLWIPSPRTRTRTTKTVARPYRDDDEGEKTARGLITSAAGGADGRRAPTSTQWNWLRVVMAISS